MNQMIRDLNKQAEENRVASTKDKLFRCVAWLVVVAILVVSGYLIFEVTSNWVPNLLDAKGCREAGSSDSTLTTYLCTFIAYAPSILVSVAIFL